MKRCQHALEILGEALNQAANLHNCTISSAIKNITPHEYLFGSELNNSRFRIFGCAAYVHMDIETRNYKLADHTQHGAYLSTVNCK